MQTSTSYTSLYSHDTDATASSFQVSHAAADSTVSHHGAGAREGVVYEENNASESLPSSEADMTASGHDVNRMELAEARRLFHSTACGDFMSITENRRKFVLSDMQTWIRGILSVKS
eukprot:gb/GECG01010894.1/.p1 GENE.gb/GECG01010894.1/~~gb/GECG01010894.1/.p1  ORF type:complete len:117 (+),score=18.55 gb/GECG01010894.1/:1-351(+)